MTIKRLIPNLFTMLNLFCGCIALEKVAVMQFGAAFFFVCLGIFFDFFDGFFARKFNVAGPLGVQLDSLADMVTSGVVPAYAMYQMLFANFTEDRWGLGAYAENNNQFHFTMLGFLIALGACYRLARFNIDTRQSDSFIGLPTPANSLFIMSLPIIRVQVPFLREVLNEQWVLLVITFLSVYLMNAEIPLFSLKIKNFSFAKYKLQVFFLVLSILMIIFLKILAVPLIILTYVLLSVINNKVTKKASV